MKACLPFIYSLHCLTTKNAKGNKSSPQGTIVKICFATTIFYEKQKTRYVKSRVLLIYEVRGIYDEAFWLYSFYKSESVKKNFISWNVDHIFHKELQKCE